LGHAGHIVSILHVVVPKLVVAHDEDRRFACRQSGGGLHRTKHHLEMRPPVRCLPPTQFILYLAIATQNGDGYASRPAAHGPDLIACAEGGSAEGKRGKRLASRMGELPSVGTSITAFRFSPNPLIHK